MATANLRYNTLNFQQPTSMSNNSSLKNSRNNRNNNNKRMNELLNKIGTDSKSLFSKMTFKKSKSAEFLDIVERKLSEINLAHIKKDTIVTIQKKIDELKKIFTKLNEFSKKIIPKKNSELQNRLHGIYSNNANIFAAFILQLKLNAEISYYNIEELKKLENFIDELINLYDLYYIVDENISKKMKENKRFISDKIIYLKENQERLLQESEKGIIINLIIQFNKLKNNLTPVKNKGIRPINNSEKTDLSRRIIDLATKIYEQANKTQDINDFKQLKEKLSYLHNIYSFIFIEPQINRTKGQMIGNFTGPYKKEYNSIKNKYNELNKRLGTNMSNFQTSEPINVRKIPWERHPRKNSEQ
jgi:hypothetical protein